MERKQQNRTGLGLIFWAWTVLVVLVLSAIPLADLMTGSFGSGMILIRPWMQTYNTVLTLIHLAIVLAVLFGVVWVEKTASSRTAKLLQLGAAVFFALTALGCLAMLLFPMVAAPGPWPADAQQVSWLRVLVFLPLVARTLGFGLLAMAMFTPHRGAAGSLASRVYLIVVGFTALDLVLAVWKWAATPKAVIVQLHPFMTQPVYLTPWVIAGVLFLVMVRARRAKP